MFHPYKYYQITFKSLLLSLVLSLVACGGGGGSSDSSSDTSVVSYSGNTSQAIVDSTQAEEIANSLINSNQKNVGGVVAGANISSTQTLSSKSKNTVIEQLKQDAIANMNNGNGLVSGISGSATRIGNCSANGITSTSDGSSAALITSFTNTELKSTITYTNLCIYQVSTGAYLVLNGVVSSSIIGKNLLSQNVPSTAVISQITFNADNLSVKHTDISGNSFTITLTEKYAFLFTYDSAGNLTKTNFNSSTDFGFNGTVYRYEIEVTVLVAGNTTTKLKFYHPTHGWVEYINTITYGCTDGSADGGSIVITGANTSYTVTPSGNCDGAYTVVENI